MAALKSKGLWDTDEEDATIGLRSKARVKTIVAAKSKPTLFDSDDGEDLFAPKLKIAPKMSKMFDEEDSDVHVSVTVDYRQLYESEVAKRKELEALVNKLEQEIASLRTLLPNGEDEPTAPASETEWDALAREEKLRRQRAIQQKASRHRSTAIKRSNAPPATVSEAPERGSSPPNPAGSEIGTGAISSVPAKAAQVGHYLDSDEGGDDTFPTTATTTKPGTVSTANAAAGTSIEETGALHARSVSLSPVHLSDEEALGNTEGKDKDTAAEKPEDPEAVKWRELAAQEKARKALARRSVRVVRRGPVSAGGTGGASGADGADGAAKPKHLLLSTHIKSSGSLQNLTAASTATPLPTSMSAPSIAPAHVSPCPAVPQSDSDWDSNSSSDKEGEAEALSRTTAQLVRDAYARRPLPALGSSAAGSRSVSPFPASSAVSAAKDAITPEEEVSLERRLKAWAAGRSTAQLLCSVPSVAQFAAGALLESGEVASAAQTLSAVMQDNNGRATPNDVRKAYMLVLQTHYFSSVLAALTAFFNFLGE